MENIKLETRFGELNIDPSQVITFPRGIPGFEKSTMWKLFHEVDESGNCVTGVVIHMQSLNDGDVSLPLTDPTLFGFNYDMELSDSEVAELQLDDPADVMVLTALSTKNNVVSENGHKLLTANMYANISAPILINTKSRIGMQKILTGKESKVDYRPRTIA